MGDNLSSKNIVALKFPLMESYGIHMNILPRMRLSDHSHPQHGSFLGHFRCVLFCIKTGLSQDGEPVLPGRLGSDFGSQRVQGLSATDCRWETAGNGGKAY